MNGTDVYNNFTGGSSQSLQAAAQAVQQLADEYLQEAQAIKDLQTRMNAAWTGSSGDAAYAGANPLAQAFNDSHVPLDVTNASMKVQSDVFEQSKSRVVPVPPAPEKPSGWTMALKSAVPIVGPSMVVGDLKSYQDGVAKTDAANQNNVRVMEQYSSVTGDTRGKIPMDYKILPTDTASIGLKPPTVGSIGSISSRYSDATQASSVAAPGVGGSLGGGPVSAAPTLSGAGPVTSAGPTGGGTGTPVTTPPNLSGSPVGTSGGTGTSGYLPGMPGYNGSDTQRPGSRGGTTGTGGGSTSGPGRNNSAAGRLYGGDEEGTGRGGSGRSGTGSGASDRLARGGGAAADERLGQNRLGGGKSTGAGNLGSAAAAEEAAASRGAARSASGAPMGAAGQRGRGEEDEEHQRPDYLIEPDPDSIFGSDVRTTPPVIGE
ncbi:PPE domain-containing protein [Amycolatopsis acidiphila]|nr:PPE domain-containing protein [Amycolatopsis acidiphila]UIJ58591.1 PPE domain-containing protein [Amycolatopsis acidiphila]